MEDLTHAKRKIINSNASSSPTNLDGSNVIAFEIQVKHKASNFDFIIASEGVSRAVAFRLNEVQQLKYPT